MRFCFFTSLLLLVAVNLYAQSRDNMQWWNDKHNWDGYTPWFNMMTTSAAYFGPNALPVPDIREGRVADAYKFEFRPEAHLSKGDQTYDFYTSLIIPLANVASFEVFIVPFEYYKMDTLTRDERLVRSYNPVGHAGGDFWFGTNIQLVKDRAFPDLLFSAYFKTASGTNLDDARYTDAPAYYLMLNAGKTIWEQKERALKLRLFGSLGVYIWQTWNVHHSQDDAIAYGLGLRLENKSFFSRLSFAGYSGYINNGDRPNVLRFQLGTQHRTLNWIFKYQYGITDFDYHTLSLALVFSLKP